MGRCTRRASSSRTGNPGRVIASERQSDRVDETCRISAYLLNQAVHYVCLRHLGYDWGGNGIAGCWMAVAGGASTQAPGWR